jgi:site-specific DNA-adenine methylase
MKPIIKWVGGKYGNLEHIRKLLPPTYNKYYEPFLGGGAVLLDLCPEEADDLVFFDSPYAPLNPTSFVDYTKEGFDYEDHVTLAALFKILTNRGCKCMFTNHDTPLIRELYKDYKIEVVDVRRSINRNGSDRTGKEVIITNY